MRAVDDWLAMHLGIDLRVLPLTWPGFAFLAIWIFCFLIVLSAEKSPTRRRLIKLLLWTSPLFLLPFAYFYWLAVEFTHHALGF